MTSAWSWLDVFIGLPCFVAAIASRLVFVDDETWTHIGLRWAAMALLVTYAVGAFRILFRERL